MKRVIVIGGGPAGLMAASVLADAGVTVALYEAMPSVGRKFLVAGHGGLNLTHSEPLAEFVKKYGARAGFLGRLLESFSPDDVRKWAEKLGVPTFIGSSGRVFPTDLKAAPLLKSWTDDLKKRGVVLHTHHRWTGISGRDVLFLNPDSAPVTVTPDATLLALGGASWPQTGSDGNWTTILEKLQIKVNPLRPANCGFEIAWSKPFIARCDGQPLKNMALSAAGAKAHGDVMLTSYGIEGGAVYELSALLRDEIERHGKATLTLDLKPGLSLHDVAARLNKPRGKRTLSDHLRRVLHLPPTVFTLLREIASLEELAQTDHLAARIKSCPLTLNATRPIAEAISSAGGIDLSELDKHLMLTKAPGVFAAGEMLDWEAPTGGYLLQGAFSTGVAAARGIVDFLGR
jgi:uncharacterized flavoprotein (TIGR03862 family)